MKNISLISLYCGGFLSAFMGLFHTQFFKIFKWKPEFQKISATNKNVLYTIHLALILLFFGITALTFIFAEELSQCSGISFGLCSVMSLFWLWRASWQVLYFKPDKSSKLLPLHYILTVYFSLLFISYSVPVFIKLVNK